MKKFCECGNVATVKKGKSKICARCADIEARFDLRKKEARQVAFDRRRIYRLPLPEPAGLTE